jgi:hypothetical protein
MSPFHWDTSSFQIITHELPKGAQLIKNYTTCCQGYKTFYSRKLQIFVIS